MSNHPTQDLPPTADPSAGGRTATPAGPGTTVPPEGPAARGPDWPEVPGYELVDEVGRGGVGVVYRARDLALSRDVAVKLLQDRFPAGGPAARRFADEARITGQLQHPGVPPVHAVGRLPDGRPFLAMKLIKGRTLDDLLEDRAAPGTPNLAAVFEGVCQAVGYAHAHGVVHRDLKPGNVMVGSFGEVQVMDWGLAKVLTGPPRQQGPDPADTGPGTEVRSAREADDATQAGSLLGTPAFMPPEQAIGAVDQIDEQSDVFGLGAVLCAVLTGQPPYVGGSAESVRQLAARGKLDDARARLAGCGADPDLVALCVRCLSVEKADRPADAGEVAGAVAALRAAADDRARRAELDRVRADGERAKAEAEAREQRKRRRVQLALAAAVGLLAAGGGAFAWWRDREAADRRAEQARLAGERDGQKQLREERARAGVEAALARLPDLYPRGLWKQAEERLDEADALLGPDGDPDLRGKVAAARRDTAFVVRLDRIRLDKIVAVDGKVDLASAPPKYAAAFRGYGLDVAAGDVADLARRLNASPVREYLLAALDDWALTEEDADGRRRVFAVTAAATGQGWRTQLADAWADPARLAAVYDAIPPAERSPAVIGAVGLRLDRRGAGGVRRLEDGLRQYPADFWLHAYLGMGGLDQAERKVGANRAALALRPGTPAVLTNLGAALLAGGDVDGAAAALREAIRLDPKDAQAHTNLGYALAAQGDDDGAAAALREAIRLDPKHDGAHINLALVLRDQGRLADALAMMRKGHDLVSRRKGWEEPSADWVKQIERSIALDGRLPGVKAGTDAPAAPAEAVELAAFAHRPFKKEYALAFRLYAGAFAADPKLAEAVNGHRYDAACAAARTAAGDDPSAVFGWDEWYALLDRAHGWLAAELAGLRKWVASEAPADGKRAALVLAHWLKDPDLAAVRDPDRLAAMPAAERERWAAFWKEVEEVRKLAAK
jgi:Flp pilus assembly protein TadD